jgi:hypothetical protein
VSENPNADAAENAGLECEYSRIKVGFANQNVSARFHKFDRR